MVREQNIPRTMSWQCLYFHIFLLLCQVRRRWKPTPATALSALAAMLLTLRPQQFKPRLTTVITPTAPDAPACRCPCVSLQPVAYYFGYLNHNFWIALATSSLMGTTTWIAGRLGHDGTHFQLLHHLNTTIAAAMSIVSRGRGLQRLISCCLPVCLPLPAGGHYELFRGKRNLWTQVRRLHHHYHTPTLPVGPPPVAPRHEGVLGLTSLPSV